MWLEVELEPDGQGLRLSGRGCRGEHPRPHRFSPETGTEALQRFATKVGRAVRMGKALDPAVVNDAQVIYQELFQGELRDVLARLGEAAKNDPILVRFFLHERELQTIPWEALCRPGTTEGFLGTDTKLLVARGVTSPDPWEPREVRGAVRVLAIAPGSDERALAVLREALAPSISAGEVEWLDAIAGDGVSAPVLFDRLRRGRSPHVVHYLGHGGVDLQGRPVLRLADDEDGEESWLTAEALARELGSSFAEELRLIVLESCEGGKAGALGSAAEILAKAGADAVVAHLWPVKADTARRCSTELYRTLTGSERSYADIGASVAAARRTLLAQSAEAFSPVLYLRGSDSVIFNFEKRRVMSPGPRRRSKSLAPALQQLIERPFTLVFGDLDEDRAALKKGLEQFMEEQGSATATGKSLSFLMQQCAMRFGLEVLHSIFQQAISGRLQAPPPPLVEAMGKVVPPGVHITLLWQPHLERSIAAAQPHRTIYSIQPSLRSGGKPRVIKRPAGAPGWKMEAALPRRFDLDNDVIVLRTYGGYSAEARPIFSQPLLTEDDHLFGLLGPESFGASGWVDELMAQPRIRPSLFVGLSLRKWRHRMLLRWLYDERPAPKDSLAILSPTADPSEPEIWDSGGWLEGAARIAVVVENPVQLSPLLLDAATLEEGA
jgi:CHAT domain-containing protein